MAVEQHAGRESDQVLHHEGAAFLAFVGDDRDLDVVIGRYSCEHLFRVLAQLAMWRAEHGDLNRHNAVPPVPPAFIWATRSESGTYIV